MPDDMSKEIVLNQRSNVNNIPSKYYTMYPIPNTPIKVKASIIRLYNKNTQKSKHVFSVFECIEPDMQIRNEHKVFFRSKSTDSSSGEKIYYTECVMNLNDAFLANPLGNYNVPSRDGMDKFEFINSEFVTIPEFSDSYLLSGERMACGFEHLFPDTNIPTWIKSWVDLNRNTYRFLQQDKKFLMQLEEISKANLGFNLLDYHEHIGSIILKWNHREIRSIDFVGVSKPYYGIAVNLTYRTSSRPRLRLNICQVEQGDCIVCDYSIDLDPPGYKHIIDLPVIPNLFLLKVYDSENNLIYHYPCKGLIEEFGITISTPSKTIDGVSVENAKGEISNLPPVGKWSAEKSKIGETIPSLNRYYYDAQKIRNVDKDKELGQFYFFDGQRDKKELNKEFAKEYVRKILDRASTRCMICDDFFDAPDFGNFLYHVKNEDVELRVMSSLGDMHADGATRLAKIVDSYNRIIGCEHAKARMLKGDRSVLHDRFIVCDDEIWAVGASFNELGARASVIYKIPNEAGKRIIFKLEEWWKDENISIDVHEVEPSPKKKYTLKDLLKNIGNEVKKYFLR